MPISPCSVVAAEVMVRVVGLDEPGDPGGGLSSSVDVGQSGTLPDTMAVREPST
jgi:hypothetical protein